MTIAVIGAGAAGLMAAGAAAEAGAHVLLFDKNAKVGRKIMITGKGRCNVTNNCDVQTVLANVPVNPRFLYSALGGCSPADVMDFFENEGVPLKTERGNRVFPVSDKALDIVDALFFYVKRLGVKFEFEHTVEKILTGEDGAVCGVQADGKNYEADRVIVATGGASYPATGSTGDGYTFAKELGHTVVSPRPSLVPLVARGDVCQKLMGLSLKNVQVTVYEGQKAVYEDFGEMLFTHFGVSGPLILSASAHMRHFGSKEYRIDIDLKPALDEKTLDKRLLSDFEKHKNSDFINALGELLPRKLIPVVVERSGIARVSRCIRSPRHSVRRSCACSRRFRWRSPVPVRSPRLSLRPAACRCVTSTPRPWRPSAPLACTLRVRCWTWTHTRAALTYRLPGRPVDWPARARQRRNRNESRRDCGCD